MIKFPSNVFPELVFPFDFDNVSENEYQAFLSMFEELLTHMGLSSSIVARITPSWDDEGSRIRDYTDSNITDILAQLNARRLKIVQVNCHEPIFHLNASFVPAVGSPIFIKSGSGIDFMSAFADLILDSTNGNLLYHLSWDVEHAAAWLSSERVQ